jgi:hypothetical protein
MTAVDTPTPVDRVPTDPTPSGSVGEGIDLPEPGEAHRLRATVLAGAGYLALSLVAWWNVWTTHPTSTTTCGCGDSSLFTWFIEWPAYAMTHGLDVLHSTAVGHPGGVNLLANTSELAIGVTLAPITWAFGPIATLNVALTLAPVISGLAMFVLVRRWVSWAPAAFVAGLCYGFSPFIMVSLVDAHLMLGMAFVPPLVVACLDELLVRQRARPVVTGLLLGLLITLQFFIGTEVLLFLAVTVVLGVGLLTGFALVAHPEALRAHLRYALVGSGTALASATVLLAFPAWYALAGPAHLSGLVWPGTSPAHAGTVLRDYVVPAPPLSTGFFGPAMSRVVGGTQGPFLSSQYLGVGMVVVVVGGLVIWRRDRRLWFFAAMAVVSAVLSLGAPRRALLPWALLAHLPVFENITPSRIALVTYLCMAVLLGLIVDHVWAAVRRRGRAAGQSPSGRGRWWWGAAVVAAAVAAVAVVPQLAYVGRSIPISVQPLVLPTWFRTVAPHLPPRQVLLVFPAPFAIAQSSLTWQAVDGMHYAMAGQGGPGGAPQRAGRESRGQAVITASSFFFAPRHSLTWSDARAVRRALDGWGATMVVIPDQPALPGYERIRSVTDAAALVTAATGRLPRLQAGAWVWTGIDRGARTPVPATGRVSRCTAGLLYRGAPAVQAATRCVTEALRVGG